MKTKTSELYFIINKKDWLNGEVSFPDTAYLNLFEANSNTSKDEYVVTFDQIQRKIGIQNFLLGGKHARITLPFENKKKKGSK